MLLETSPGTARKAGRATLLAAFALAALALGAALIASPDGAGAQGRITVVLGKTNNPPPPACPEDTMANPCEVVADTTGFQIRNDQQTLPMRVKFNGRVVAWTLTLSEPTNTQRAGLNGLFGQPPEARLAILKRVPRSDPPRYRLRRQSAIRVLSPYLGQTVRFKLGKPLPVRKGNVVALTVPTWAPGFANELDMANAWRASREEGMCRGETSIRDGRPHQVVGTRREYGCRYNGARLLYTATVVKDRPASGN